MHTARRLRDPLCVSILLPFGRVELEPFQERSGRHYVVRIQLRAQKIDKAVKITED